MFGVIVGTRNGRLAHALQGDMGRAEEEAQRRQAVLDIYEAGAWVLSLSSHLVLLDMACEWAFHAICLCYSTNPTSDMNTGHLRKLW